MANIDIYTKATCPFCVKAKQLLSDKNVSFNEIKIDGNNELRSKMIERANGAYTVPQIFIGEKHIGGCDDLFACESRGQLDPLLS